MREAHCHLFSYGQSLSIPSLADCSSLTQCLDTLRRAASDARAAHQPWIRLQAARPEAWPEARWPSIAELDAAAPDLPCIIMSFDWHTAACNARALALAGLKGNDTVPPLGIVRADDQGNATGLLLEHAAYKVWSCAPEPTPAERLDILALGIRALADLGFNEAHDLHSQDWLGPALARLEREGRLPLKVWLYPAIARLRDEHRVRAAYESSMIRLAGGKVFADGTLNARTALMLAPYREPLLGSGGGPCGRAMVTPHSLDESLDIVDDLNLHLAVHAIGDGAVRMVLDAWQRKLKRGRRHPHSLSNQPNLRIEHCELIDEADVPRFAKLGVTCSVQPCHLLTDIEVLTRQLPHRLDRVLPLRELIHAGCFPGESLWFGSDAPIVRPNPEDSITAAVERRRPDMRQDGAIGWSQRIERTAAEACFRSRIG